MDPFENAHNESSFVDLQKLTFSPQQASELLGVSKQTLIAMEENHNLKVDRVARGTVTARSYSLGLLFEMASLRNANKKPRWPSRPITISVFVPKGGTGKTTTAAQIAILLGLMGKKTAIIDNDPQADMSTMLSCDPDLDQEDLRDMGIPDDHFVDGHLGNLMRLGGKIFTEKTLDEVLKKPFGEFGPHLIPAMEPMEDLDTVLRGANGSDFRYMVFLEQARTGLLPHCDLSSYDFIVIDNAVTGNLLSRNALVAADILLCPMRLDKFSYRALARLSSKLAGFARDFNRAPEVVAIPTMYVRNRPRLERNWSSLKKIFPGKVTETPLYYSEDYSKSLEEGIPLVLWSHAKPNSAGAIRKVFEELLERIQKVVG